MAISNDLFMAILSMDAYNRGYNAGMKDPNATADQGLLGTQIGNASIGSSSSVLTDASGNRLDQPASFYAQSDTLDGKTIVA